MALATSTLLYRGAAATSSATLYTVPSSTTTVVTEIMIANTVSAAGTYTITLDGTNIATTVAVGGNDTVVIPCKQVLGATKTITGFASATTINFSISGVQIA